MTFFLSPFRSSSRRASIALAVCAGLLLAPLPVSATTRGKSAPQVDRASLVLQRFTFGPRPGEAAQVRSTGVDAWFERQLAPERIDDSALDRRLAMYPALEMSQEERLERYPTPAMIRQFAKSGSLPDDTEARAIVGDQVEFYQMKQQAKAASSTGLQSRPKQRAAAGEKMAAGDTMAAGQETTAELHGTAQRGANPSPTMTAPLSGAIATVSSNQKASSTTNQSADGSASQNAQAANLEQSVQPMPQPEVQAFLKLSPSARYKQLLHMAPEQLIALRKGTRGQEAKLGDGLTPLQKETLVALAGTNRMISNELFGSRLLRDIYSDRQLEAVMTDFWLNHFNVYIRKDGQMPSLLPQYEQVVRAHALGRFEDLLQATAKSPAILMYLDNAQSTGPNSQAATRNVRNPNSKKPNAGLNENYARELMELHTLGVNGGYTQRDVTEVAKVFTGWTMERPGEGGQFIFNERRHEPGAKQVLGQTIKEGGQAEGDQVLHMLSTSPATAHFISLELAERFVSDKPATPMVDRMAQTFLRSNGDIKAVLRTMVHSPEFFAPASVHAKLKTPLEYVVSIARATNAEVQNPVPMAQALERLGMPLYGCQPPTGYKWDSETWLSSSALVSRMNFALVLSSNKVAGSSVDVDKLVSWNGDTATVFDADRKEHALEAVVLDTPASEQTRTAVLSQTDDSAVQQAVRDFAPTPAIPERQNEVVGGDKHMVRANARALGTAPAVAGPAPADKQGTVMLGLLLGSPEFQRR